MALHTPRVLLRAAKARAPFQRHLRRILRALRPYRGNPRIMDWTIGQGLDAITRLKECGADLSGTVLEIGSGWFPIVPLLFRLAGAHFVTMTDVEQLMDRHTIASARDCVLRNLPAVAEALGVDEMSLFLRLRGKFPCAYKPKWRPDEEETASADIIVSRAVLEHIPAETIVTYFREFDRILKPGGLMYHRVDHSDHWEHKDKSLHRIDMLRYEEGDFLWRMAQRSEYQNRLRHSDFLEIFRELGWTPVFRDRSVCDKSLEALAAFPLAKRFRERDPQDIATMISCFVLRRTAEIS